MFLPKGGLSFQVSFSKWKWSLKGYFKNEKKANLKGDIPAGILEDCADSCMSIYTY